MKEVTGGTGSVSTEHSVLSADFHNVYTLMANSAVKELNICSALEDRPRGRRGLWTPSVPSYIYSVSAFSCLNLKVDKNHENQFFITVWPTVLIAGAMRAVRLVCPFEIPQQRLRGFSWHLDKLKNFGGPLTFPVASSSDQNLDQYFCSWPNDFPISLSWTLCFVWVGKC